MPDPGFLTGNSSRISVGTSICSVLFIVNSTRIVFSAVFVSAVVLDAVGWTGPRDLDLGATFVHWWWLEEVDAFTAVTDLVSSEGPPSIAYVGPDGTFIFRDRHHRLLRAASLTPQATFTAVRPADCDTGHSGDCPGFGECGFGEGGFGG